MPSHLLEFKKKKKKILRFARFVSKTATNLKSYVKGAIPMQPYQRLSGYIRPYQSIRKPL